MIVSIKVKLYSNYADLCSDRADISPAQLFNYLHHGLGLKRVWHFGFLMRTTLCLRNEGFCLCSARIFFMCSNIIGPKQNYYIESKLKTNLDM